jgi:hypothetical protein
MVSCVKICNYYFYKFNWLIFSFFSNLAKWLNSSWLYLFSNALDLLVLFNLCGFLHFEMFFWGRSFCHKLFDFNLFFKFSKMFPYCFVFPMMFLNDALKVSLSYYWKKNWNKIFCLPSKFWMIVHNLGLVLFGRWSNVV